MNRTMRSGVRPTDGLRRTLLIAGLAFAATGCGSTGTRASAATGATGEPGRRMNVLFLIADDLRVGGAFGSDEVRTPNIDRLAARGVHFGQAYCQFPLCAPSRASMLTGLRPNTLRLYDLTTPVRSNVPDVVTLPQHFRRNGYFTARVGKLYHQGVPGGIGKDGHDDPGSWDVAVNPVGRDKQLDTDGRIVRLTPERGLGTSFAYLADDGPDEAQTDGLVASKTIELLAAHKDRPFFIAAGFYRPHVPEVAPRKYFEVYPTVRYAPEGQARRDVALPAARGPSYISEAADRLSPEQQAKFVQAYYAATTFMDAQVGRILAALEESGVADRTIVVFTSDHGFNLGEHGGWQKQMLWDESTRVPLVIYAPGSAGNGLRSNRLVELLDLYPTLADLAGLPPPDRAEGRSLRPLLARPDHTGWKKPALSQVANGRSVRFGKWRYTEWGKGGVEGVELYDRRQDPGEYVNLAGEPRHRAVVRRLKRMLPAEPPPSTGPRYDRIE